MTNHYEVLNFNWRSVLVVASSSLSDIPRNKPLAMQSSNRHDTNSSFSGSGGGIGIVQLRLDVFGVGQAEVHCEDAAVVPSLPPKTKTLVMELGPEALDVWISRLHGALSSI